MKKISLLIILLAGVLLTAGCTEENAENPAGPPEIPEGSVVEVNELGQINEALAEGPVFLKLGAEWCSPCRAMKPILAEMAVTYEGRATVMSADIDKSPQLAAYFKVGYIPDSCVIVGFEDGKYRYMQEDGNVTEDRYRARMIGLHDKETYEERLDLALQQVEKDKAEQKNETAE
ncbi:thioredoxin [Methanosarcina sp. KYL-1]|uniref:thioredoxin n=1 Tax=Methanosarcina sp. KYL-1 TaxID=2602068 RepID=UPI00210131F2|nr:thioredoxin [Methanosarcina sp. KYL-1]MCQ1534163.1 thioredoxin [Methanosarcina sp. KYL-1]